MTSIPSVNLAPWISFGNWLWPSMRRQFFCAPSTSLKKQSAALSAVRGIVFVPDYLANAGGVIDFHQETIDDQPAAVLASVARIGAIRERQIERGEARSQSAP